MQKDSVTAGDLSTDRFEQETSRLRVHWGISIAMSVLYKLALISSHHS